MSEGVLSSRPTVIFTGAYGSGKTEVAINYARAARAQGRRVTLVDCDIVTPYFRVGDHRQELMREGLRVIAPPGELASFELPAVSPEFTGALSERETHVVLDVGGDPAGARFLAGYAEDIAARGYAMWLVVNPFRPATCEPEAVVAQARELAEQSRLQFTGVVANPNLGPATEAPEVHRGLVEVGEAASALGLPIILLAVEAGLASSLGKISAPVLPLDLTVKLPWETQHVQEAPPPGRS